MAARVERFEDYWSGGDPGTMNRFLIKTITPMMTIVISYILFVTLIGPAFMKNRKPIEIRRFIIAYNFGLVAFYFYFLIRGALFIPKLGFSLICGSLNSNEIEVSVTSDVFALGFLSYCVRYIELLDTVFLVLSKKFNAITPLHVFHHAIVPVFGWFGFRSESSGYLGILMGVNSMVHIVMYTYYAIAALGPQYQKYIWWKKYLTSLQIFQFFIITLYMNIMFAMGCATSRLTFLFCTFLNVSFFFLFINYYRRAYNSTDEQASLQRNGGLQKKTTASSKNGVHLKNGVPATYKNSLKKKE